MRRALSLLVLLAGPLVGDQVVLRDGRVLETKKPPVVRGRQAVLVLADGKLVTLPVAEIDAEKTAALAARAASAPAEATPAATPPPSLVEAARASERARRATVVLTDQDVAGGWLEPFEERSLAPGRVVVSNVVARKAGAGTAVTGSVQNVGEGPIEGVALTVEVVGADGATIASALGQLSADSLAAGEKATFTAQVDADAGAQNVRVMPRWREPKRAVSASAPGAERGAGEKTAEQSPAEGTPAPTPVPTPAKAATPAPRSPDVAAPPANAPVGAPETPGGAYLPPPSSSQPRPPGGG